MTEAEKIAALITEARMFVAEVRTYFARQAPGSPAPDES